LWLFQDVAFSNIEDSTPLDPETRAILEGANKDEDPGEIEMRILRSGWGASEKTRLLRTWKRCQRGGMLSVADAQVQADRTWVENMLNVPVGVFQAKDVSVTDLSVAERILNEHLDGLRGVKLKLLEVLSMWSRNKSGHLPVLGLLGPPGVGKTTVAKALAEVLNRPCQVITIGGRKDAAELKGHSPTYVGATWGVFTDALVQSRCMDPVIYLDEVDKVGVLGQEIFHTLLHVLDPSSHDRFQDSYLNGLTLDLSRCLFILSMNDVSEIPAPLRDRMDLVEIPPYGTSEKESLLRRFLWPAACKGSGIEAALSPEAEAELLALPEVSEAAGVRPLRHVCETLARRIGLLQSWSTQERLSWGWPKEVPSARWILSEEDVLELLLLGSTPQQPSLSSGLKEQQPLSALVVPTSSSS
jgi:ATP-dependent Lon protease